DGAGVGAGPVGRGADPAVDRTEAGRLDGLEHPGDLRETMRGSVPGFHTARYPGLTLGGSPVPARVPGQAKRSRRVASQSRQLPPSSVGSYSQPSTRIRLPRACSSRSCADRRSSSARTAATCSASSSSRNDDTTASAASCSTRQSWWKYAERKFSSAGKSLMRGLLAGSGRGRGAGHDSIADAQCVRTLQDELHGEHVLGPGLAALDRDAGAGVEVRVKHQAVAALAVKPRIHAILVFRDGLRNEVLRGRQVAEARGGADVFALEAVEQLLLGPADVAFDQVAAGLLVGL